MSEWTKSEMEKTTSHRWGPAADRESKSRSSDSDEPKKPLKGYQAMAKAKAKKKFDRTPLEKHDGQNHSPNVDMQSAHDREKIKKHNEEQ